MIDAHLKKAQDIQNKLGNVAANATAAPMANPGDTGMAKKSDTGMAKKKTKQDKQA